MLTVDQFMDAERLVSRKHFSALTATERAQVRFFVQQGVLVLNYIYVPGKEPHPFIPGEVEDLEVNFTPNYGVVLDRK